MLAGLVGDKEAASGCSAPPLTSAVLVCVTCWRCRVGSNVVPDFRIISGTRSKVVGSVLPGGRLARRATPWVGAMIVWARTVIPEVEIIPLGAKICQPAGKIVIVFEKLLIVQYHCGSVSAVSVGRFVIIVLSSEAPICGERYRCAIPPTLILILVVFLYTTLFTPQVLLPRVEAG
jgi:hypothetical protein